jgi:von Willebrand factor type A domain
MDATPRSAPGSAPEFIVEVDPAGDLSFDAERADALLTVCARPAGGTASDAPIAEILIMDASGSMAGGGRIGEARRAACAAIDALRDGTFLGIVAGNHEARTLYPRTGGLARVDARVREAAKYAVLALWPARGTAIGRWLTHTAQLLESAPAGIVRHATLYTDGKNEHESPEQLGRALAECADRFVCDVRGLGQDWHYEELLRITQALHGDAEAVVDIADLTADFTRLMRRAQGLKVPRAYLSLQLDPRFRLGFVRQTTPVEADLTDLRQRDGDTIHIPLGSWGLECRQYQVSLRFDAAALPVGRDTRAAGVALLTETPSGARRRSAEAGPVVVHRHAYRDPPRPVHAGLTRAENAHELGMAMRACAGAYFYRDFAEADRELQRAFDLARGLGDAQRLRLLRDVATEGENGAVRLRPDVTRGQMQKLGLDSTKHDAAPAQLVRSPAADPYPGGRVCPACRQITYGPVIRGCEACGRAFDDEAGEGT